MIEKNCIICGSELKKTNAHMKSINAKRYFTYCKECDHVSLFPLPSNIELDNFYFESNVMMNKGYQKAYVTKKLPKIKKAFEKFLHGDENILEIGPGPIGVTPILKKTQTYFAIEKNEVYINNLSEITNKNSVKSNFFTSMDEFSQKNLKIDLIIMNAVLEHIPNPVDFIGNLITSLERERESKIYFHFFAT